MVKIERSFPAPKSLAEEAQKTNGRYDRQDVIDQLKKDFHNKCYICEIKALQDPNVELAALRAQQEPNTPLTMEELREMDGEPVWTVVYNLPKGGYYCLCNEGVITAPSGNVFDCKDIPEWTFYRRKPEEGAK